MYLKWLLLIIILFCLIIFFNPVFEGYQSPDLNWRNGIYMIPSSLEIKKLYTPYKNIVPVYQYAVNDSPIPTPE